MSNLNNLPFDVDHPKPSKNSPQANGNTFEEKPNTELDQFKMKYLLTADSKLKPGVSKKNFKDRGLYIGELSPKNLRHGKGIFYFENTKDVYYGEWKDDLFHGLGTYFFESGDKYVGELFLGKKHGMGTYYYRNGNIFEGEWKKDYKDGNGKLIDNRRNEVYEGWFYFFEF